MDNLIIKEKMLTYSNITIEDEQLAQKEILQELALYALSTTDFFKQATFIGGTKLRIVDHLARFSEDLDFSLLQPTPEFNWQPYINRILLTYQQFGIEPTITDRSKADNNIKKLFIKDNSVGKLLDLQFHHHPHMKFRIKLEIDINPPAGGTNQLAFLNFPIDHKILCHDLNSGLSGKCHALLSRAFDKGRDWFDFIWYVNKGIKPNLHFLNNALQQSKSSLGISSIAQLLSLLKDKLHQVDILKIKRDIFPLLSTEHRDSLDVWSRDFLAAKIELLNE